MAESFFRLDGKSALVTGGGQGIGEAICRRLASAGARVVVYDRSADSAGRVAHDINGLAFTGDVTSEPAIAEAFRRAEEAGSSIDILVNNAGITGKAGRIWELSRDDLESVMAINLVGPWLLCRTA